MDIKKQNFISVDSKIARSSYGEFFTVGESVGHQDETVGNAIITGFELDVERNECKVHTNKGFCYLDFCVKVETVEDVKKPYQFVEVDEPHNTDGFWYDLFDGGYIKPEEFLMRSNELDEVQKAVTVLKKFYQDGVDQGIFEEI